MLELDEIMEGNPDLEPAIERDVEEELICQCVHDQIREVILSVQRDCERDGLGDHFLMFCLRHLTTPNPSWKKVGEEFGLDWQEAKNKAWTVQVRVKKAILEELRTQGMTEEDLADQIRELIGMFRSFTGGGFSLEDRDNA